jgi:mannose-6-phosphate isomerase-like protein (cupin superfamily)
MCFLKLPRMSYTHKNLRDVQDIAPANGFSEVMEARFANDDLDTENTGLAFHRVHPGQRGLAHRHFDAEEVYVVLSGSGRAKLDDDVVDLAPLDAIRVAPQVIRAFEGGAEGLEMIVFGPRHKGDGEILREDVWGGS